MLEPAQDIYRFQAQLLKLLVLIGFFYTVTLIVILAPNTNFDTLMAKEFPFGFNNTILIIVPNDHFISKWLDFL